ncbi:hypothetical protein N1851_008201 [Merluccius polli]|uniref:Uncharacterized protein n=1 Tax=Merluccius polli TaxID=89951 RepID=A0AA47N1V3_MERPO|nr:hypothetical protein N1851_008201 [Merluccius polli]
MMLVKHCPDPALARVLKCKISEKWTANEIQKQIRKRPEQCLKPNLTVHAQTSVIETVTANNTTDLTSSSPQNESVCIQSLIGLLNLVLEQKAQTAAVVLPSRGAVAIVQSRCRVC